MEFLPLKLNSIASGTIWLGLNISVMTSQITNNFQQAIDNQGIYPLRVN